MSALQRVRLLGRENVDDLTRYQADAEEAIEREEREKQEAPERSMQSPRIAALRGEIIQLRAQAAVRDQEFLNFAQSVTKGFDKIESWVRTAIEARTLRSEAEMCARISERFGELRGELHGHLSALDPDRVRDRAAAPFKFASEKTETDDGSDGILDLPRIPLAGDLH